MTEFVTIATVAGIGQAATLRAALEAAGMPCRIPDEHLSSMAWQLSGAIGGVRVQVPEEHALMARQFAEALATAGVAIDDADLPDELRDDPSDDLDGALGDNLGDGTSHSYAARPGARMTASGGQHTFDPMAGTAFGRGANDARAWRAWRVALIGSLLWPVAFYGFALAANALQGGGLTRSAQRKAVAAFLLCSVLCVAQIAIVSLLIER